MNVAVINLKEISKNIIKIVIGLVFLICVTKVLFANIGIFQNFFSFKICTSIYTSFFNCANEVKYETDYVGVLKTFSPMLVAINEETKQEEKKQEEKKQEEIPSATENDVVISKKVKVEAVSERNIEESYNITYGNVKIRNQSNYELAEDIFSEEGLQLTNTKKILIYHTHTCESYTPSEKYNYTMTGNYRTTDNNYNVVKLGQELSRLFKTKRV